MPEVTKDTRVLKDPVTGELISVPAAEADRRAAQEGLEFATLGEISKFNEREKYGSAGQTALGAFELAGEAATLGLYAPEGAEAEARRRVLRRDSPVTAFAAEAAGTLAPGLIAGAGAGALAARAGLSARAAAAASAVAEGGVSGFSQEQIQAREEGRDIDVGNILLYGVGGEIAGRVIPKALGGAARRAVGTGEDALSGADNALVRAERRAGQSSSDVAEAAPGPERDRFLRDNAREIVNDKSEQVRQSLDRASSEFQDLGDISKKRHKIAKLVSKEHPDQDKWVAEQLDGLEKMRAEIDGAPAPKYSLADRDLESLGALTDPKTFRPESFDSLRGADAEEFRRTGRVPASVSKIDHEKGIRLREGYPDEGRDLYLVDGRHRLTVAKESGTPQIWGTVYNADGEEVFRGFIPLKAGKAVKGFADVPGLGGVVKKLNSALDDIQERMSASRSAADRFIAADQAKRT